MSTALAARLHRAVETLHAFVYFVPEADEEFTAIGLRPGRMSYFASRSAPMGPVSTGVVTATFYNFNPELVARHIPRAWTLASPEAIVAARLRVADRALRRLLGAEAIASPELAELARLTREATVPLQPDGRALYAGHATLDWPDEPHLVLWHATSLLREYRGDGHIAALMTAGLTGLEAIVTHTATGHGFTEGSAKLLRGWSEEQWTACRDGLVARGLMNADGLTRQGHELRQRVEDDTDRLDTGAATHLGEQRTQRAIELGKAFSRVAIANGAFPPDVFASR